ncbi:MAG: sulfotransferase [Alphaproteobacteria bacterium]|nr:sulfotransferase [Alphaproteobacteria bacterium]
MKILAIQNFGTSGTTLMHSYLDGHPQVLSLPGLFGYEAYKLWFSKYSNLTHDNIISEHLNDFNYFFDSNTHLQEVHGLNDMGDNHNKNASIDKDLYLKYFEDFFPEKFTRKDFYISMMKSYNLALGRDITNAQYMVFPIHSQKKSVAQALCEDFEHVYFLYMLREPIQNIGSLAKHIAKNTVWLKVNALESAISQIYSDESQHIGRYKVHGIVPYYKTSNSTYGALKLEDLHSNKHESLAALCKWLSIDWNDCLLDSTFCGYKWWNRKESARVNGQNEETIGQKHIDILNIYDKERIVSIGKMIKTYYPAKDNAKYNFLSFLPIFEFEKDIEYYKNRVEYIFKRLKLKTKLSRLLWPLIWALDYINIRRIIIRSHIFQNKQQAELELIYNK